MAKRINSNTPASTPVGNFPPAEVDTETEEGQTVEENLDSTALTYLSDPQAFIDAFVTEANAHGDIDTTNIHIATDVLKKVLGVVSTVVPGAGLGVQIVDAIDQGIPKK